MIYLLDMSQVVLICSHCQKESGHEAVDTAIRKAEKDRPDLGFSHGVCKRHAADMYRQMGKSDDWIQTKLTQNPPKVPDMKEHPELVKQYSQGIFTPEDLQKSQSALKEILQKRAGIIKS